MKSFLLLLLVFFAPAISIAQQNLVPNPSFEDTTNCSGFSIYLNSLPWFNPNIATPDYYSSLNTCGYNRLSSGIINGTGFQLPMSGDAFAGIYLYLPGNPLPTREYIEVDLIDSLIANKDYLVNFYVSRANKFGMAVDAVGAYISNNPIFNPNNSNPFTIQPQIENPPGNLLIDSLNWTLISGIYSAFGGEKYITIGNFYDDTNTGKMLVDSSFDVSNNGYYYIDDVSVNLIDTMQSVAENFDQQNIKLTPNPAKQGDKIHLVFQKPQTFNYNLEIYNLEGQLILNKMNVDYSWIDTSYLKRGVYLIKIFNSVFIRKMKLIIY